MWWRRRKLGEPLSVDRILRALRLRMRAVSLGGAVLLMLAVGMAIVLATVMADHVAQRGLARGPLSVFRWSLLTSELVLGLLLVAWPLWRRLDDLHLVELVERVNPRLHNQLIAAVQFSQQRTLDGDTLAGLRNRAAQEASGTRPGRAIPIRGLVLAGVLTGVVGLAFATYAAAASKPVWPSMLRALGDDSIAAPTHTYILSLSPEADSTVPAGSPVAFEALVRNPVEPVEVLVSRDNGLTWLADDRLVMRDIGAPSGQPNARRYVVHWPAAAISGRQAVFSVRSGDAQSEQRSLLVLPAPAIQVRATVKLPDYAARPELTLLGGQVQALAGSAVTVQGRCNLPLTGAELVFAGGAKVPMTVDGQSAAGSFQLQADDKYRIVYTTRYKGVGGESAAYPVRAIPDRAPVVRLAPVETAGLMPGQKVRISGDVSDDVGLARVELVWGEGPGQRLDLGVYAPPGLLTGKVELAIPAGELGGVGDRTIWLEARDFFPPDGQVARSDSFQVTLLPPPASQLGVAAAPPAGPAGQPAPQGPSWRELANQPRPRVKPTAEMTSLRQQLAQQIFEKTQRDQAVLEALAQRLHEAGWEGPPPTSQPGQGAATQPQGSQQDGGAQAQGGGQQGFSPGSMGPSGGPIPPAAGSGNPSTPSPGSAASGASGSAGAGTAAGDNPPGGGAPGSGGGQAAPGASGDQGQGSQSGGHVPSGVAPAPGAQGQGQADLEIEVPGAPGAVTAEGEVPGAPAAGPLPGPQQAQERIESLGRIIHMTRQQILDDSIDRALLAQLNMDVNRMAAMVDEYSPLIDRLLKDYQDNAPAPTDDNQPRVVAPAGVGLAVVGPQIVIGPGSGTQDLAKDTMQGLQSSSPPSVAPEFSDQVNAYFESISRRPAPPPPPPAPPATRQP